MHATVARPFMLNYRIANPGTKLVIVRPRIQQPQGVAPRWQLQLKCVVKIFLQWDWTNSLPFFLQRSHEPIPTHRLDEKLHPRFHAGLALAIAVEKPYYRGCEI